MIGILLCLLAVAPPSDAVVDSMIRDFYENSWFAERYEVDTVAFVAAFKKSPYGRYNYEILENDEKLYAMGYAYNVTVGYWNTDGFYRTHDLNCFFFYMIDGKWQMEQTPYLPWIDPRVSPHRDKGKKI